MSDGDFSDPGDRCGRSRQRRLPAPRGARRLRPGQAWLLAASLLASCSTGDHLALLSAAEGASGGPVRLPALPYIESGLHFEPAFEAHRFDDPVFMAPVPGSNRLLVAEREGRLWAFEGDADVAGRQLVLDLSGRNQGEEDSGLLGFAFHPDFGRPESESGRFLYLHYAFTPAPIVGAQPSPYTVTYSRLSRFEFDAEAGIVNPDSELVLINQLDESVWHQGGALFFNPTDGFLYLAVGDEGLINCVLDNCQRIDKDLFSGVLRLDVDQRGGDISHPIPRQPESGETAHYFIPNDNPFVGRPGVLEEFYALGLRSPHRMSYDTVDELAFIGEVGQEGAEEINVLQAGANYQWARREGLLPFGAPPHGPPEDLVGVWTPPLLALPRETARSVIGGYVYRGMQLPGLWGRYLFADFATGRLWSASYEKDGESVALREVTELLESSFRGRVNGITSLAVDERGEIYALTLGETSAIQRLAVQDGEETNLPRLLSETGIFSNLESLVVNSRLRAYAVNSQLYSDGAQKQRWLGLPEGQSATGGREGAWEFPPRSVFVKHFEVPLDARKPEALTRLETRILVTLADGSLFGATYRWQPDQKDATLLTGSETVDLQRIDSAGQPFVQAYDFPSPGDCLVCHNTHAGFVLGVRSAQLNRSGADGQNQLEELSAAGIVELALEPGDSLENWPRMAALEEAGASLELRVRSYLASNCAMCHGSIEGLKSVWDARFGTPLGRRALVGAASYQGSHILVDPGNAEGSRLWQRVSTTEPGLRMPPLGRRTEDVVFRQALTQWIESLPD